MNELDDLNQKNLFKKHLITEQSISKIKDNYSIDFLSYFDNIKFSECVKLTLIKSRSNNDSNEVAVVFNADSQAVIYGDEHSVDVDSNYLARDIIKFSKSTVILCHNHPSLQTFSLDDLRYFFINKNIKVFCVVSNLGVVEILYRAKDLDLVKERNILIKMKELTDSRFVNSVKDEYNLARDILKILSKYNYYRRLS